MRCQIQHMLNIGLYGEKSVQTKMPMRGPLKNCWNRNAKKNIEETEMHSNNATKAR